MKCYNCKDLDQHIKKLLSTFKYDKPNDNKPSTSTNKQELYHGIKFTDLIVIVTFIIENYDKSIDFINTFIKNRLDYVLIQKREGEDDKHYKIINDRYRYLFSVRGNVPSLKFRYLQLRKYGGSIKNAPVNQEMYEAFLDLYNYNSEAMEIEKDIYELSKDLHQKYLLIYVEKKRSLDLSEAENDVLQNIIHKSYLDTRSKTTVSKINDLLTIDKPSKINKLLQEKRAQKELSNRCI